MRNASTILFILCQFSTMNNFKFYALTRFKLQINASDCFNELKNAHAETAPSRATVFRWFKEFKDLSCANDSCNTLVSDGEERSDDCDSISRSPRTSRTQETIQRVQEKIREDCRRTVRELASVLDLSKSTVHRILTEDLKLRNVCSVWVPHILTEANRQNRVNCAKHIRRLFFTEGMESFCKKLVVQDETWFHLDPLATKKQNRCWLENDQRRPQVVRRNISSKKVMLLVAFTPSKKFSVTAMPPGENVNSETIIEFVRHTGDLWRCLRSQPIHLEDVLWQWDNARPHSSRCVKEFFQARKITTIFQSPYSPDMNLCDRFLFTWMKSDLSTQDFKDHLEVQEAALRWARQLSENSLQREVQKLIDHCQCVIDSGGDYITS